MENLTVPASPLIEHKLTLLRDKSTPSAAFRRTLEEIAFLLTAELSTHFSLAECTVETPLEAVAARQLAEEITLVPIMRAGMGMADAMLRLIPEAHVAHIGLARNEEIKEPEEYYFKAHSDIANSHVVLIDPMLATGGSAVAALDKLKERGVKKITFTCLIAAPEGVSRLTAAHPDVQIIAAALDRELDGNAYIRPGLGDAGDRIYGTER